MPRAYTLPDEQELELAEEETILHAALRAGIPFAHACGGRARCSTCRIRILAGQDHLRPRTRAEAVMAGRLRFDDDIRLACQTRITGEVRLRRLVLDQDDLALTSQLRLRGAPPASGRQKQLAILFADIRNFTPLAETLPAYDVIHLLNRFFLRMGRVVQQHGGTINAYLGDGFMALFGLEHPSNAALRATEAGVEMLSELDAMRAYLLPLGITGFRIGIGVHYGQAVVGGVGTEHRRVTAVGDAVNVASRIEQANKPAGTAMLVSEAVYRQVASQVRVGREVDLTLPGKSGQFRLYEIVGLRAAEETGRPGDGK
jgi:adenylate cyclase